MFAICCWMNEQHKWYFHATDVPIASDFHSYTKKNVLTLPLFSEGANSEFRVWRNQHSKLFWFCHVCQVLSCGHGHIVLHRSSSSLLVRHACHGSAYTAKRHGHGCTPSKTFLLKHHKRSWMIFFDQENGEQQDQKTDQWPKKMDKTKKQKNSKLAQAQRALAAKYYKNGQCKLRDVWASGLLFTVFFAALPLVNGWVCGKVFPIFSKIHK